MAHMKPGYGTRTRTAGATRGRLGGSKPKIPRTTTKPRPAKASTKMRGGYGKR